MPLTDLHQGVPQPRKVVRGTIANTPTSPADNLYVILPGFDPQKRWGPCAWLPQAGMVPAAGALCLVALDDVDLPWVMQWTGAGTPTGTPGGPYSVSLGPVNDSFETNTTGWATSGFGALNAGAALTRITGDSAAGAACGQIVTTSASTSQGAAASIPGRFRTGVPYIVSAYMKGASGGELVDLGAADNTVGGFQIIAVNLTAAWKRYAFVYTPTVDLSNFYVHTNDGSAAARTWMIDLVQVFIGA